MPISDQFRIATRHAWKSIQVYRRSLFKGRRSRTISSAVLEHAARLTDPVFDQDLTAYWAATPAGKQEPEALQSARDRFLRRTQVDSDRKKDWNRARSRCEAVEEISDARVHFSSLVVSGPAGQFVLSRKHRAGRSFSAPWSRMARSVGIAVVSMYLVALAVSYSVRSDLERAARLRPEDYMWTELGQTTRGRDSAWMQDIRSGYERALSDVRVSISSFPLPGRINRSSLIQARSELEDAIRLQSHREVAPARAFLILGKVNVLLDQPNEARSALEIARARGGSTGEEAGNLLALLQ